MCLSICMTNILFVVNYQRLIIITQIIDYQRQLRKLSYILVYEYEFLIFNAQNHANKTGNYIGIGKRT